MSTALARVYAPTFCIECRRLMRPRGTNSPTASPQATVEHSQRHTCVECWRLDHPRKTSQRTDRAGEVQRDILLDEYRFALDSLGLAVRDVPSHLGMNAKAFEKAMYRARSRGDRRAADWRGFGANQGNRGHRFR